MSEEGVVGAKRQSIAVVEKSSLIYGTLSGVAILLAIGALGLTAWSDIWVLCGFIVGLGLLFLFTASSTALIGPCPSCGSEIQQGKRSVFTCRHCEAIVVGKAGRFYTAEAARVRDLL